MVILPRSAGRTKLGFPKASSILNRSQSSVSTILLVSKGVCLKPLAAFRARAAVQMLKKKAIEADAGRFEDLRTGDVVEIKLVNIFRKLDCLSFYVCISVLY